MVAPLVLLLIMAASLVLYRYLARKHAGHALWRSSLAIGTVMGTSRAMLACAGWYCAEHAAGPLQIPAFALAMLAWPEAIVLDTRRVGPAPLSFYPMLAGVLIVTTILAVSGVALAVQVARGRDHA